ncbi:MAG: MFS transporter [Desulfobacterales bacterium]
MNQRRITFTLCLVEVLAMIGIATFPALLPTFIDAWHLNNTQAGWINAVYYGGYMISVPVLVSITDRCDARHVVLFGALGAMVSALGFALFATGFRSAVFFRLLAGISLAGIYMPGLKLLGDHTEGALQSRYVSFYTASFSIGLSLSFLLAGEVNTRFGWRWAFVLAALCALGAVLATVRFLPPGTTRPATSPAGKRSYFRFDFKPVWAAGRALAFIFGYAAHMWELFGSRSWIVAFLTFSQSLQAASAGFSATRIAFLVGLIGLPASIAGNEIARLFGRKKTIIVIMSVSAALCSVIGFSAPLPYAVVVGLCLLHAVTVVGDSAALTAGAVGAAPAGCRGATLALHSTLGFGAAFLGPLAVGMVLDLFSSQMTLAWGMAYLTMAAGCALGPFFILFFGRRQARSGISQPASRPPTG